jgi:release factor glutamine methyltransferase
VSTVEEVLRAARAQLATVDPGGRDAELLLAAVLGTTRAQLHAAPESALPHGVAARLAPLLVRRARGEPVAYLLGRKEFWSLELDISDAVLVPRPETELVVETALTLISHRRAPRVADLGTGSGAIGLAIASERPDALVTLIEISAPALAVARANAVRLGLTRVRVALGSWYEPLDAPQDLIVSNPPYLTEAELSQAHELQHEPKLALCAGVTGLEALERLIALAPEHLDPGAGLVLEHGSSQGSAVRAALARAAFVAIATHRDLAGHERVTHGSRPS